MPSEPILVNSSISSTGDITAVKFYGDGSGLVNITTTNLPNPRTIAATGDATWSVTFDGTQDVSGTLTLANSGVTAGTYTKVTVDAKGRVTTGANLGADDLPSHTHTMAQISDGSVLVKTTDTATVTNTMLAGGIANNKLSNSSITLNGVSVSLGGTATIPSSSAGTLTIGSYLTGITGSVTSTSYNGSADVTIAVDASSANTVSKLVARDASGNFSAGIITATLNGVANNISQYVVNQDVGLTSNPTFANLTASTLKSTGTNGLLYLNRGATNAVTEVHFQTASTTDWKLGTWTTASPNISFATADGNSKLILSQSGILTVTGGITGVRYPRPSVNCNLGNPTVEEIAMFGAQMSNKIRGIVPYLQEESTNGTTWTTSTRLTANQLSDLVIGDGNIRSNVTIIPITTVGSSGHYRLTWDAANTNYVWLNALYFYITTKGSNVTVKLEIYNNIAASWSTVVTGTVNGWPTHGYIPHDSIVFSTSLTEPSAHRYARVTFSLASSAYSGSQYGGIQIGSIEWMGGYPAGRRNVEYYDGSLNAHWSSSVFASSFVDENDSTYYLDPNSTGTALTVAGAATLGRGITGGDAIPLVLSTAEGGTTSATSIRAYPRGNGSTANASARIRFTSNAGPNDPNAGIQFYTGRTDAGVASESLVLSLTPGTTNAAFAGDLSVGGNLTVTGSISAASFIGTIASSSTANTLTSLDKRVLKPSETSISRAQFGFTSWNNDGNSPYADYLHLRSYLDASGGLDNLVMFRKTGGIGMRIWQQTFGSTDAYSTYKDIAFTDGTNATGTWTLNTSGYAAYIQGSEIALAFSAAPRTSTQPFSVKLFDNYAATGWPAQYGTVMEIYGKLGHQIDQLHFGNDRKIYHRSAFYNETAWTSFQKILEADDTATANTANKIVVRDASGNFSAGTITANLVGNASTVTDGVYTTGSYENPTWISSLAASKLTGDQAIPNTVLPAQLRTEQISTTSLAAGAWYTIATNDGNRATGKFIFTDPTSSLHQSVHFYASHHYGVGNKISIIHNDSYGGGGPVRYIRIKEGDTYEGAMLQIYIDDAITGAGGPFRVYLYEDVQANGWTLKNFIPDGTNPGGVGNFANLTTVAALVDLDQGSTIFSGHIYSGTSANTGQYRVYTTNDSATSNTQNTLVLRDGSGNFSAGAITLSTALAIGSGGTGANTAAGARTALGATTVGSNIFTLTNPSEVRFLRLNADNTVSALTAEQFKTAIGAGSGGGSVTSVAGTGTVNGITLTGTVTSSGSLTLGGTLSGVSLATQVTGTLPIANGGTNATTSTDANTKIVNFGQIEPHTTYTDFNTVPSTWGFTFVHQASVGGVTVPALNAPHANSNQWYRGRLSLGSGYDIGTAANSYWLEMAMPRYSGSSYGNLYFRTTENGVTGAWYGVRAAYAETAGSVTGGIYTTGDQTITGVKTFNDTIKASRIEASSSANITLVPAAASGEVVIRRGSDDNLGFTLRATGANNGYIRSGATGGIFTIDTNEFRVRSFDQLVERLTVNATETSINQPVKITGNLTAGDGLFINSVAGVSTPSRSYYDAAGGAHFHTPGAMVRKDSDSIVPGEMPATFVLYNSNGGNNTGSKLVFASRESGTANANSAALAAIVSQKVSATDGNWATGNLSFHVKSGGAYNEVLSLASDKTAAFKGAVQLNNNVAQYWLDSTGTTRRVSLVSGGNASYFGPVDSGWGSVTYVSAGTSMILRTNGAAGTGQASTFVEALTIATSGNVTLSKDLIVNGTGGITLSTSSGTTPSITATSTNGVAGYFVSDGHLNDSQGNTSTHFIIKRSKNTATQNRWAMQLQGGENTNDSPVEGSNLVFGYSNANTGTWTNNLTLTRAGNASVAGNITGSDVILGSSGPSVKTALSLSAPRQGLLFDGASGATLTCPAFGTSDFTVAVVVRPDSLADNATILAPGTGAAGGFWLKCGSAGLRRIDLMGYNGGTGLDAVASASGVLTVGKWTHVVVTRTNGTIAFYVNGIPAGPVSGQPSTQPGSYLAIARIGYAPDGYYWNGAISVQAIENRALSAAEVVALYESGTPASTDYWPGGINVNVGDPSTGLVPSNATVTASTSTSVTGINFAATYGQIGIGAGYAAKVGQKIRLSFTISGVTDPSLIYVRWVVNGPETWVTLAQAGITGSSGLFTREFTTAYAGANYFQIRNFSASAQNGISITNWSARTIGLAVAPDATQPGHGSTWYDLSGNSANITLSAGTNWTLADNPNITTTGSITAGTTNSEHNLRGGDDGNGTSILRLRNSTGAVVNFASSGRTHFYDSSNSSGPTSGAVIIQNGGLGVGQNIYAGGTAFGLSNANNGETGVTVTNTNTGASALAKLGTWNGTVGVNLATFSTAYSGRSNESWLYTNAAYALKLGTNNTERIGISSTGEVSISSSLAVTPLFTRARKLEAHVTHAALAEDYLRIGSNTGGAVTYAAEFGYGITAAPAGDPQIRINTIHSGTVSRWLSGRTQTGNAIFANSLGIGGIGGVADPASRLHVYENTSAVNDSNGITIEQAGASDSTIQFVLTGVQRWSLGVDNSDSDKFKIGTGNLGAADRFVMDTSGNVAIAGSLAINGTGATTIAGDPTSDRSAITRVWAVSRGENLITNGSGLMGNNYNFSGLTFDPVHTHGGGGSFRTTAAPGSFTSDELMPVDPEKNYRFSLWARSGEDGGTNYSAANIQYAGVVPYDIDGLLVEPFNYSKFPGSTDTTLAVALNPGDTTVTLTNSTGWANVGSEYYQRQFGWYGYTNSKGYTYPNYTYTRNISWNYTAYRGNPAGAWVAGGLSGNVITLNAPWPGPALAAGTPIRNINSGGTYKYITMLFQAVPNTWTRYEGNIGGIDTGGVQNNNQFPYGTSFVKLLFLSNYHNVANNTIRYSDLWFSEMSSRNLEPATGTLAGVVSTASQTFGGSKTFNTDVRAPIFFDSVDTGYWISPRSEQTSSQGGRIKRNFTVNAEGLGTGYGLALYPEYTAQSLPVYGIVFAQTSPTLGTYGSVTGDWATYFTMSNSSNRGWIFRNSTDGVNVASVSNTGSISASQLTLKKTSQSSFGILPWDGYNYLSSNITYNTSSGTWVHSAPANNNNNQVFSFEPGTGVKWYASNDGTSSWNVSNAKILWNSSGEWKSTLANTLTLATSGTGLSGSATFNNSGAATFTVTSNATSANTVSTIVARDASGNFSAGTITGTQLVSNAETGTAPLAVTSSTLVTNLNADLLDGLNAASANTVSTIVARDASGNFSAGTITAALAGNASTASTAATWTTSRTLTIGSTGKSVNGSADVSWSLADIGAAAASHNHTSLTDVTSITFAAEASDSASISTTITGTQTCFDFNLTDDNNNDLWRWRFTPSAATAYNAMTLTPTANGVSNLAVAGSITGTQLVSNVANGTAPLAVTSSTLVTNLNADLLDGLNSASANTASTIVARDASGNFSAGTITATLTGTASALVTSGNYQVNSLGVGTEASATAGEIRATNNVTAYYSDERLKTRLGGIEDPLKKVMSLSGFYFAPNDTAMALGYQKKIDVGVSAQEVQKVLPEIIAPAPIDPQYMTVRYEKMIPLLIEAIKEQQSQIEELKNLVAKLTNK